jgi:hypothetical protein
MPSVELTNRQIQALLGAINYVRYDIMEHGLYSAKQRGAIKALSNAEKRLVKTIGREL